MEGEHFVCKGAEGAKQRVLGFVGGVKGYRWHFELLKLWGRGVLVVLASNNSF